MSERPLPVFVFAPDDGTPALLHLIGIPPWEPIPEEWWLGFFTAHTVRPAESDPDVPIHIYTCSEQVLDVYNGVNESSGELRVRVRGPDYFATWTWDARGQLLGWGVMSLDGHTPTEEERTEMMRRPEVRRALEHALAQATWCPVDTGDVN